MSKSPKIGLWRANRDRNELELDGQTYKLRPRTMDVLTYMAERPGQVLSVDDLVTGVWNGVVVSDGSVYQAISELRGIFETAKTECPIETIPKRGYLLRTSADLCEGSEMPPRSGSRRRRLTLAAALLAVLIAGTFAILQNSTETPSVAVLAFADLSPDGDKQYLADGMAEAIYNYLAQLDGLRVSPLRSSFHHGDGGEDMAAIADALEVRYLLEASVRSEDDQLRITVRLTDTVSGDQVWFRQFDREARDIFDLEEDIAEAVADATGVSLGVGEWTRVTGMTRDVSAYDAFLRGKDVPLQQAQTALNHLNRAVSIDPDFGLAWLRLAIVNSAVVLGMSTVDSPANLAAARDRADHALERARELMPGSPLLLEFEGLVATTEGRWTAASDYYKKARLAAARNPSGQIGASYYADFLLRVGRVDEATVDLERARTENPLDLDVALMLVLAYGSAGETDAALLEADRSLTLEERSLRASATMAYRGLVALGSRDRSAIGKWFATPPEDPASIDPMDANSVGLAYLDEPVKALEILERSAQDLSPLQAIPLATWAAYFGDAELALEAFSEAPRGLQTIAVSHLWLPIFADMRRLPGFKDRVRDLGLVGYWRESSDWSDFCAPSDGDDDFECH